MARRRQSREEASIERLVTGAMESLDAPPGYAGLAEALQQAGQRAPVSSEPDLIVAMAAAARAAQPSGRTRAARTSLAPRAFAAKDPAMSPRLAPSTHAAAGATRPP